MNQKTSQCAPHPPPVVGSRRAQRDPCQRPRNGSAHGWAGGLCSVDLGRNRGGDQRRTPAPPRPGDRRRGDGRRADPDQSGYRHRHQCRVNRYNASHPIEIKETDAPAESDRVKCRGLLGKHPGVDTANFNLGTKPRGTSGIGRWLDDPGRGSSAGETRPWRC